MPEIVVSQIDIEHLRRIRQNVANFMKYAASAYGSTPGRLLDIAPHIHEGARPFFSDDILVETFDIDPLAGCTHTGDLCEYNACLTENSYQYVVCTEVLEHTFRPWDAIREIWRVLRNGGYLFLSTPFNFRIHGPLPDCWRFTEHGLRHLLTRFKILELEELSTPGRDLMPIHYTVVAQKNCLTEQK